MLCLLLIKMVIEKRNQFYLNAKKSHHFALVLAYRKTYIFNFNLRGDCRPFKAKVEHESKIPGAKDGEKCFEYEREFTCTIWCLWRPELKVFLTEDQAKKRYLGKVINPW